MRFIALFIVFLSFFSCEKEQESFEMTDLEQEIFDYLNVYRKSQGKTEVTFSLVIQEHARAHSANMASGNIPFSHDGFSDRAAAIKAEMGGSNVAENIAQGATSVTALMKLWRESTIHNENMLGNFTHVGIAAKNASNGTPFHTLILLKK